MQGAFSQFCFALLASFALSTVAQGETFTLPREAFIPNAVVVTYDPADGSLSYDGNGLLIVTMELISNNRLFDWSRMNEDVPIGPFDVATPEKFFRLDGAGMASLDFGPVLPAGLSVDFLMEDLQVDGAIDKPRVRLNAAPGGGPYLYVVPEPSSSVFALLGLVPMLAWKRWSTIGVRLAL